MKKIFFVATVSLLLVACGKNDAPESSNSTNETQQTAVNNSSSEVIAISSAAQLNTILSEEDHLTIVDLYADWCGPCKLIAPIIRDLSTKYPSVSFTKVNVDQNQDLARKYQARSIPLVLFIKDGEIIERVTGARSSSDYTALVERYK